MTPHCATRESTVQSFAPAKRIYDDDDEAMGRL